MIYRLPIVLLAFTLCACGAEPPAAEPTPPPVVPVATDAADSDTDAGELALDMANAATPLEGVLTGGQPTLEDLETLAARGYKTVVNLRPAEEPGQEGEAEKVAELGMSYVSIPVAGAEDLTEDNVRRLSAVLDDPANKPLLVHCASSNRVGALLALEAAWVDGADPEAALALGEAGGLTRLEGAVRERLGLDAPGGDR